MNSKVKIKHGAVLGAVVTIILYIVLFLLSGYMVGGDILELPTKIPFFGVLSPFILIA